MRRTFLFKVSIPLAVVIGLWVFAFSALSTRAASGFGSGITTCSALPPAVLTNPIVVSGASCTRDGIQAALTQGGSILLNCSASPITIPIDKTLNFNPVKDTILDGNGLVTLDGNNAGTILFKGWHDASKVPSVTITLQNIRLIHGRAPASGETSGGALSAGYPGTRLHIIDSTFENNTTTNTHMPDNQGGAIFVHNSNEITISGSVFQNNSAGNGGAVGGIATGILISNSLFKGNQAVDDTDDSQIVRGYGGALSVDGVFNDTNPNTVNRVHVCGSRFEQNKAVRGGGAVDEVLSDGYNTLALFERSSFVGNEVSGVGGKFGTGGGIYHVEDDRVGGSNEDNFEIVDSTFSANKALAQGGGVWVTILGRGQVMNTTFSDNTTTAALNQVGMGGAMAVMDGTFMISNTTFANNHAAYMGGALFGSGQSITLSNTIFYRNTLNKQDLPSTTQWQGYQTSETMLDGGNNIQFPQKKPDWPTVDDKWITASPTILDPLLLSLADNGGPTQTMGLQAGSPAIDAGNAAHCSGLDQRRYMRQGRCDIGAYEFGGVPFVPGSWVYLPGIRK
jgi:hypothetical protein